MVIPHGATGREACLMHLPREELVEKRWSVAGVGAYGGATKIP